LVGLKILDLKINTKRRVGRSIAVRADSMSDATVIMTEKAQTVYLESLEAEGLDPEKTYLKIGAKSGGCSGWKFTIETTDTRTAADSAYFHGDVRLIINQIQLHTVIGGIELDYSDKNLVEQGFVFKRLGTGQVCGCGESFTPLGSNQALGWK
jgi:iron-sulfur cluster assembly protein